MSFEYADLLRAEQRTAFAVPDPPPRRCVMGMPVHVSRFVPPGTILVTNGRVWASSDYAVMLMAYGYDPLFSRNTLGTKEAQRDARRS